MRRLNSPIFFLFFSVFLASSAFLMPNDANAVQTKSSVFVYNDGRVSLKGGAVFQIIGPTFFVQTNWDESYIKWVVRPDNNTKILRRFGGVSKISEIKKGDILDVEGILLAGADTLNIVAQTIVDLSLENETGKFSGKVVSVNASHGVFTILTDDRLTISAKVATSTLIMKGILAIPLDRVQVGDVIVSADGTYHFPTKILSADSIVVYQDKSIFNPKNFQGKLKSLSSVSLPVNMVVAVGDKDYIVYLDDKAEVLNKKRKPISLARFVQGDIVRFYGAIREADQSAIDAELVRNIDL